MNRRPGNQHAQRRKKCSEPHQPEREAVNPHVIVDIRSGNPLPVDLVLKLSLPAMEINRQVQRQNKSQQCDDKSKNANVAVAARQQHQQQSAHERHERHESKNDRAEIVGAHRTPIQIMKTITTAEPAAIQPAYDRMLPDCMWRTSSETRPAPSPASFTAASIIFLST